MKSRKLDAPKVPCPVCKAEERESEYKPELGMCWKCYSFLAPERGGKDHGLFMVVTEEEAGTGNIRLARIRPRGFWSDVVEVRERRNFWDAKPGEPAKYDMDVRWSTGGTDGTVDSIRAAENFARALDHAIMLAKIWKTERQEVR